jgi:lathosterol oxidase
MQAHLFLALFVGVQIWTFNIHDNMFLTANDYVNGAAHHAIHHLEFNYNYGQYFTLWDRLCGTHRFPENSEKFKEYFDKAFALKQKKQGAKEIVVLNDAIGINSKLRINRRVSRAAE